MEFRAYPKGSSRTIIELQPVLDDISAGNQRILCINDGLLKVIRQLLLERGLWLTTYSLGWEDEGYYVPSQDELNPLKQEIFQFAEDTMADCGQDIKDGLLAMAASLAGIGSAIANKSCCGGAPGTPGGVGTGGTGTTPETPVVVNPLGDPPTGYDTWDEYYSDVCSKATWLIDTITADVGRMGLMEIVGVALTTLLPLLAAMLLDPIPGDELLLLAGVLLSIGAYGGGILAATSAALVAERSALICSLYSSDGPSQGKTSTLETFRGAVESETSDPVAIELAVQLMGYMLSWDALNVVYSLQPGRTFPAGDCSGCGSNSPVQFFQMTNDTPVTWTEFQATRTGANTYELPALSAYTITGIANSVYVKMQRAATDNFGFKVVIDQWNDFLGDADASPREVQGWGTNDALVVDFANIVTEQELKDLWAPYGHLARIQVWSQQGAIAAGDVVITLEWEVS